MSSKYFGKLGWPRKNSSNFTAFLSFIQNLCDIIPIRINSDLGTGETGILLIGAKYLVESLFEGIKILHLPELDLSLNGALKALSRMNI